MNSLALSPSAHKRARILLISFLLVSISTSIFAMPSQEAAESPAARTVQDMRGRTVTVPEEVESIIALGAGSLRLLSYLGATDRIIAVEDQGHGREKSDYQFFSFATYRLAFPDLRERPGIGSAENHEGIIAAHPDIIVSSIPDTGQLDNLQEITGIPVFGVDVDVELQDQELFFRQLVTLGAVLDREERASELIAGIAAVLTDIENRAAGVDRPKRAYVGGMMYYGPADLLRTTGDYIPFDFTGTENVMPTNPAGNLQPYMTSLEDLIAARPEYVFIDAANLALSRSGFETNRTILAEQVPAFAERRVFTTLVYKYYGTNWENQLINVYSVGKTLYPEQYSDIAVAEKAEEIWRLFFDRPLEYNTVIRLQKTGPGRVDWFN